MNKKDKQRVQKERNKYKKMGRFKESRMEKKKKNRSQGRIRNRNRNRGNHC